MIHSGYVLASLGSEWLGKEAKLCREFFGLDLSTDMRRAYILTNGTKLEGWVMLFMRIL